MAHTGQRDVVKRATIWNEIASLSSSKGQHLPGAQLGPKVRVGSLFCGVVWALPDLRQTDAASPRFRH